MIGYTCKYTPVELLSAFADSCRGSGGVVRREAESRRIRVRTGHGVAERI